MIIHSTIAAKLFPASQIDYHIILPVNPQKTCLWLHGYQELVPSILINSALEELANEHHIAILLPQMPGKYQGDYYFNRPWQNCYAEDFLIKEYLPEMITKYQLPLGRENTFIAGISMGGFGSLLLGSHFPDIFSKIISISGAFIINDVTNNNYEVTFGNFEHFSKLFGEIITLREDPMRNPTLAAMQVLESDKHSFPSLFLCCGLDDMLYKRNTALRDQLISAGADVAWMEQPGDHTWEFFNNAIEKVLKWL